MAHTADLTTTEAIASLCVTLQPDHQSSLLQFAKFLKSQEEQQSFGAVDEEDEAEWDRMLNDPARVANFAQWADQSLSNSSLHPVDPKRL